MSFDIRQLRYAIAAADHRSFQRAAKALSIDQSHLSRHIRKLEQAVGVSLFTRSRAGVELTNAGEPFIRDARRLVAHAERTTALARSAGQGRAGRLVYGHYNPVSAGHLRTTLLAWRDAHPDVCVEDIEDGREALLAGLDAGLIDIAVMTGDASYHGLRRASFWSQRVLVALPERHRLAEREAIQWTDLRDETFLLTAADPGPEFRDMLLGQLSAAGWRPTIKMLGSTRDSLLSMLGGGTALTLVSEGATGAHYPQVVMREPHGPHGQTLIGYSGYWRTDNENPALRRFLGFVRSRYSLAFEL